jgi:hydrogenase nickel incorporation protein HypA/HybF
MHELPITQSLLEITLRHAEQAGAGRVTKIHVKMGQLSSIVDESVQFYWNIIARDTCAEDAELSFEIIPAAFRCLACGTVSALASTDDYVCSACGSPDIILDGGDQLYLDSIEIE